MRLNGINHPAVLSLKLNFKLFGLACGNACTVESDLLCTLRADIIACGCGSGLGFIVIVINRILVKVNNIAVHCVNINIVFIAVRIELNFVNRPAVVRIELNLEVLYLACGNACTVESDLLCALRADIIACGCGSGLGCPSSSSSIASLSKSTTLPFTASTSTSYS